MDVLLCMSMDINSITQSGNLNEWIALVCKKEFFPYKSMWR